MHVLDLADNKWKEVAKQANLGKIIDIQKTTEPINIPKFLPLSHNLVHLTCRDKNEIETTYIFDNFGLENVIIDGTPLLKEEDAAEYNLLTYFPEYINITKTYIQLMAEKFKNSYLGPHKMYRKFLMGALQRTINKLGNEIIVAQAHMDNLTGSEEKVIEEVEKLEKLIEYNNRELSSLKKYIPIAEKLKELVDDYYEIFDRSSNNSKR